MIFNGLKQMEAVPIIIIVGAPVLASMGVKFAFVENIFFRILMVASLIYASLKTPLFSLLVLLAIVTLLFERNHIVVAGLPDQAAKIPKTTNLYPIMASPLSHVDVKDTFEVHDVDSHDKAQFEDSIPDLKEGPSNHDSPDFYKSLGLA